MVRSAAIAVRVEPRVKRAAEKAAQDDHRSVASLLEKLLVTYLKEQGYLPGDDDENEERVRRQGGPSGSAS